MFQETAVQAYMNPLMSTLIFGHSFNKKSTQQCCQVKHLTLSYSKVHLEIYTLNGDMYGEWSENRYGVTVLFPSPELCLTHRRLLINITYMTK